MTKRLSYDASWASSGLATDPDLDTTHPSYEANRYEEKGWHSEKPPETWQNFLTQITDEKVIAKMVDGIQEFDASVTYAEGAIYRKTDKFYKIEGGAEQEILSANAAVYAQLVVAARTLLTDHLAADNPHNDTVNTLVDGSYIKTDVNLMFGSETDPRTIPYHKLQTGAATHGETAASVGTLPTSGGTFTGDIIFLNEAIVQVSPSQALHYNKATALFELVNGTYALGVDSAGNGFLTGSGGSALILSEANLDALAIKYNNSFALPMPIVSMNLENALSDAKSVGNWIVDTASAPVFESGKGLKIDGNAVTLTNVKVGAAHTILVRGATSASGVAGYYDANASASYSTLAAIAALVGPGFTHIKQVIIYPLLSTRQKTMLVNK